MVINRNNRIFGQFLYWFGACIVISIPSLMTLFFVHYNLNSSISSYVPNQWNDTVDYWHEAWTFSEVGFNGGQYGANEDTAPLKFTHFGVHGPVYPMLYGTIGRIIGWNFYNNIYINMAVLALGCLGYILLTKPSFKQLIITGLVLLTFLPLTKFIPMASIEPLNLALAMIMAGIFYILLDQKNRETQQTIQQKIFIIVSFLLIFLASIIRFSWALLFIPFLILVTRRSVRNIILMIIFGCGLTWLSMYIVKLLSPTLNNLIYYVIRNSITSPLEGLKTLYDLYMGNWNSLFRYLWTSNVIFTIEVIVLTIGLIISITVSNLYRIKNDQKEKCINKGKNSNNAFQSAIYSFQIYNLTLVTILTLGIYVIISADRIIGPHLLLSLLIMVKFKHYQWIIPIIAINIIAMPLLWRDYSNYHGDFGNKAQIVSKWQEEIRHYITYKSNAQNVWCNTVLTNWAFLDFRMTTIPAGIGITYDIEDGNLTLPPKSQYIFMEEEMFDRLNKRGKINVDILARLKIGTLYRNLDSFCLPTQNAE